MILNVICLPILDIELYTLIQSMTIYGAFDMALVKTNKSFK